MHHHFNGRTIDYCYSRVNICTMLWHEWNKIYHHRSSHVGNKSSYFMFFQSFSFSVYWRMFILRLLYMQDKNWRNNIFNLLKFRVKCLQHNVSLICTSFLFTLEHLRVIWTCCITKYFVSRLSFITWPIRINYCTFLLKLLFFQMLKKLHLLLKIVCLLVSKFINLL